ncbi:MAG: hypothetical protein GF317_20830 [Candidatus Lokiarchaeota archaeon]|nr:hypothetical protein [Candidatus Lokiarchaeota archaeon]
MSKSKTVRLKEKKDLETNKVIHGNCLEIIREFPENSIDAIVTDPPYGISILQSRWDSFKEWEFMRFNYKWGKRSLKILKPGGGLFAFSSPTTYDLLTVGMRFAGYTIRDMYQWNYGSTIIKGIDISKAIDSKPRADFIKEFKMWLDGQIDKSQKTVEQIDKECGFTASSYRRYYSNDGWASNLPSKEKWKKMKEVIGLSNEWDFMIENNLEERGYYDQPTGGFHKGSNNSVQFTKKGKQLKDNPIDTRAKQWKGWRTKVKSLHEPILLAQKQLDGTFSENVLKWGIGALNVDACRIPYSPIKENDNRIGTDAEWHGTREASEHTVSIPAIKGMKMYKKKGRLPSNVFFTHHQDCKPKGLTTVGKGTQKLNSEINRKGMKFEGPFTPKNSGFNVNKCKGLANYGAELKIEYDCHPKCPVRILDLQSGELGVSGRPNLIGKHYEKSRWFDAELGGIFGTHNQYLDKGGASKFFYSPKTHKKERNAGCEDLFWKLEDDGNLSRIKEHEYQNLPRENRRKGNPIISLKPINVMRWLVRQLCPKDGIILDPFAGSGTTLIACIIEGINYIGIEQREAFAKTIIPRRIKFWNDHNNWDLLKDHNILPKVEQLQKERRYGENLRNIVQPIKKTLEEWF